MPFYSLICRRCGHSFEKQASIAERSEKRLACPACGGTELAPDYSAGSAAVKRPSEDRAGGCPHGAGCGCCGCGGQR